MMNGLTTLKLRSKILLAILVAWGLMLIFGYGISLTLKENYIKLEKNLSTDEMQRVQDAIQNVNNSLATQAANWAVWDDGYQFIIDRNKTFYNKNLVIDAVLPMASVDLMLIFDEFGKLIYQIGVNADRSGAAPIPPALIADFNEPQPLAKKLYKPGLDNVFKGLLYTPETIYLIGSHSVTKSDGTGPAKGTWVMGQRLSKDVLKTIMERTKLNVSLTPIASLDKNSDLYKTYQKVLSTNDMVINKVSPKQLDIYNLIRDINGEPIAVIQVHLPRNVYSSGMQTIQYFNAVLFIAGLIFTLLLYTMLSRHIINRVQKINKRVISIQNTRDFNTVIPVEGTDELASVSVEANKMLRLIRDYDLENKKIVGQITQELDESTVLTEQLQLAESFLSDLINSMPSLLVIADKEMRIVQTNKAVEKELHLESEQLKGQNIFKHLPYLSGAQTALDKALSSNQIQTINKLIDVRAGEPYYYNLVVFPLSHENLISIRIDDVTQWIKLEETMLQSDKMASIGVLTAGVAHEINNPINFVLSATSPLRNDLNDINVLISKYAKLPESKDFKADSEDIQSYVEEIDVPYLVQEIAQLINGIQDGISRTATIVSDLQSASRSDEHRIQKINVHESIDSSLTLLIHRYKGRIEIIKDYGELPLIDAYSGRLNQVFMNIIANACDAIADKGELQIKTYVKDKDHVEIAIKDSGVGIPTEMTTKIFDPFFTTKEVGKGTGLGLSITRSIIEELHGQIRVTSQIGQGSEFFVTLPINNELT